MRGEQTAIYWPPVPLSLAALLSRSAGLLNQGSWGLSPLWEHLISNWLQTNWTSCNTGLYHCLTPTCFQWVSHLHPIQPIHSQGHTLISSTGCTRSSIDSWVESQYVTLLSYLWIMYHYHISIILLTAIKILKNYPIRNKRLISRWKWKNILKKLKKNDKIWVKANKSRNIYNISSSEYRILHNKIPDNYKVDYNDTLTQININTAKFTSKLHIKEILGKLKEECAYILSKDRKQNFHTRNKIN